MEMDDWAERASVTHMISMNKATLEEIRFQAPIPRSRRAFKARNLNFNIWSRIPEHYMRYEVHSKLWKK